MRISRFLAAALLSGAVSQAVADSPYAGGVMIMNEETTGNPGNGSINFSVRRGRGAGFTALSARPIRAVRYPGRYAMPVSTATGCMWSPTTPMLPAATTWPAR